MELSELPPRMARGGVVSTAALTGEGFTASHIRRHVRRGSLTPLRRGWYAFDGADAGVVRAVRSGGVLGCASALAFHGAWDVQGQRLHVHRSEWGRRSERHPKLRWCGPGGERSRPTLAVDDLDDALRSASRCLTDHDFVAVLDSLRHRRLCSIVEIESVLAGQSNRVDRLVSLSDRAESGTESLVRLRLRALGITIVPQVTITGVGRVDFLVGRRLVIEVDSVKHHTDLAAYRRDRLRDQRLQAMGYAVLRITWEQIMFTWSEVEQTILAMVRRGLHTRHLVN